MINTSLSRAVVALQTSDIASRMVEDQNGIVFNEDRDIVVAHHDVKLDSVLHVFDQHWHGIRSATACLPGGKLGISHLHELGGEETRHIVGLIFKHGFKAVCFQGYSEQADRLAASLYRDFGSDLRLCVVTHVTTSQFEHTFEMNMLGRIYDRLGKGVLWRAGSVKPNFHLFHNRTWHACIFNMPPDISRLGLLGSRREPGTVFIPVENTWRKNLYTQVIAAHGSDEVDRIMLVNWPSQLDEIFSLDKLNLLGFQPLRGLLHCMGLSEIVMNVTLSECQPMTQLEALTVGTPTMTGPLRLPGFSDHPLGRLTEVTELDDPGLLRARLEALLFEWRTNARGLEEMMSDFRRLRIQACVDSYREFLQL